MGVTDLYFYKLIYILRFGEIWWNWWDLVTLCEICWHDKIWWDSVTFGRVVEIRWDMVTFWQLEIFDEMIFGENWQDFVSYSEIYWDSVRYGGVWWDLLHCMRLEEIWWDLGGFDDILWHSIGFGEIQWYLVTLGSKYAHQFAISDNIKIEKSPD